MGQWSLRVGLEDEMACFVAPSETLAWALCSNSNRESGQSCKRKGLSGPRAPLCQPAGSKGKVFNILPCPKCAQLGSPTQLCPSLACCGPSTRTPSPAFLF